MKEVFYLSKSILKFRFFFFKTKIDHYYWKLFSGTAYFFSADHGQRIGSQS